MKLEEYFRIWGTYELVDGLYNVEGSISLIKIVEKLPVKFGIVSGSFSCSRNKLKTLEGSPKSVGGGFFCNHNKLTSLEGSPKSVVGSFKCHNNNLISLEGSPTQVGLSFVCYDNDLITLEGAPISIRGSFSCDKELCNTKEYKKYLIMRKLRQ